MKGGLVIHVIVDDLSGGESRSAPSATGSVIGEGGDREQPSARGLGIEWADKLEEARTLVRKLRTNITFFVHYVESCTSTQDVAAALASEGAPEGVLVLAEEQVSGRGRHGRSWASPRGGLWFTIVLRPGVNVSLGLLSLSLGLAVARAVRELCGVDARLKWPNDVVVGDRKLAGVLVEGEAGSEGLRFLLAGVGVNVNNELPPELSGSATSLRELLGRPAPRLLLLARILQEFDNAYSELQRGNWERVVSEWKRLSATLGRRVRVITQKGVCEGVAVDVDSNGGLIVEADGHLSVFHSGEVIHVR